jgi:hypothetical protein
VPALVVGFAIVAAPRTAAARPARFTLEVSPQVGTVQDQFVATVHIELLGVSGPERYWHPEMGGLRVVDTTVNQTTAMRFDPDTGQELRTIEIRTYVLQASRPGRYILEPARIRVDGADHETRRIVITVHAADADMPEPTRRDPTTVGGIEVPGFQPPVPIVPPPTMFLHVVADKSEAYIGEQVTVTWMLYTRSDVYGFEPTLPNLVDFWSEPLYTPRQRLKYHDTKVDGVSYLATVVAKRGLFPIREGELEVPPFSAKVISMRDRAGRRGEELASPTLAIHARPLPSGAPPGFDATYVGVLGVESSVDRAQIDATDSLTLTLRVRGEGAVRRFGAPRLKLAGFDVTGPREESTQIDVANDVLRGHRELRYWLVPTRSGQLEIPAIAIPYFDPRAGRYQVATSQASTVHVVGVLPAPVETTNAAGAIENPIAQDIRPIMRVDSVSSRSTPFLYRSIWMWLLGAAPPTIFLGLLLGDRVRERLRKETPRSRLRRARGRAKRRMRVAEIHLRGGRPVKFFAELSNALYEHIEERVGEPIHSMTSDEMRAFLGGRGFPATTIERVQHEIQEFDYARFAPATAGAAEMRTALRRLRELLREIEKIQPRAGTVDEPEEAA